MPSSEASSKTITNEPRCTCPGEQEEDAEDASTAVALLEAKVQRVQQWLARGLRHGRDERRLLEAIIDLKEEDLEYHRQRLQGVQKQVARLESDLMKCRCELLQCRRQHRQTFIDNVRLRGDNCKLQILMAQLQPYRLKQVGSSWVHYTDTAV